MDSSARIEMLLTTYPRTRPALAPDQQKTYVEHYQANRAGKQGAAKLAARLESWMHRRVAEGAGQGLLLEIGAGNLNHVPYLPAGCVCDAVEPFEELWKGSPHCSRLRHIYSNLGEIPGNARYDCIFSIAVLEHLTDLPLVLAQTALLLRENGMFRAGFPSEGGFLWGAGWRLTTGIEYRLKRKQSYAALMRHEHLNSAGEILCLLHHFYQDLQISRFPFPAHHLSFYTAAIAAQPRIDRCEQFMALRAQSDSRVYE